MRAYSHQQVVAIICLIAVGLNTAVFSRGFVRCTDVDGSTRMEWGCTKDDRGHCQAVCSDSKESGESTNHSQSEPCEDTPATSTVVATDRTVISKSFSLPSQMPVTSQQIVYAVTPALSTLPFLRDPTIAASPPSLLTIRTVVMLV